MGLYHDSGASGSGALMEAEPLVFVGGTGAIEEMSPMEGHSRAEKVGNFLASASSSPTSASLWPNAASSP